MADFLSIIHADIMDPDRFVVALGALILVSVAGLITGPQYGNANPLYWQFADKILGWMGVRLDRPNRKKRDLVIRAIFFSGFAIQVAYMFGGGGAILAARSSFSGLMEILLLSFVLTSGTVWFSLLRLYFALKEKKVGKGEYYTIARSTRINLATSDDYGITRVGMGFAARSFDKGLVAPVVWYLIAGLPGAFIYAGLAALAWRFGRDGFCNGFGKGILALEKFMGFVPHVLSGVLLALAGLLTPTGGMSRALVALLHAGDNRAPYEQGGLPVTAMSFALDVSLGGPVQDIDGAAIKRTWIGPDKATAQLKEGHLRRALYLSLMAHLLFIFALVGGMIWAGAL